MSVWYQNIRAYRVAKRLCGEEATLEDDMAEYLPCGGCGAPKGYFCRMEVDTGVFPTRLTCMGIIGAKNPRTAAVFSAGAKEIMERGKGK